MAEDASPAKPQRIVVGVLEHPDAAHPTGVFGEPEAVKFERNQLLGVIRHECPAFLDELALIAGQWAPHWDPGAGTWPPDLETWAQRWRIAEPWLLERARGILEEWLEDESGQLMRDRSLMYSTSGPARFTVRLELSAVRHPILPTTISSDESAETREDARQRLQREALAQINAYLDGVFGPDTRTMPRNPESARWAVLHRICRASLSTIARGAGLEDPDFDGKAAIQKAIKRYCAWIGWR